MQIEPLIIFIPLLAAVAWFDFKSQVIPNKVTYPAAIIAVTLNALFSSVPWPNMVAGGLIALVIALVLRRYAGLGGGDLKLMVVIGLMFGSPVFLVVMVGGLMMGSLVSLSYLVAKRQSPRGKELPLGFYISLAGIIVCGWLIFGIMQGG